MRTVDVPAHAGRVHVVERVARDVGPAVDYLDVNAVREKKLTNVRAAGSDETVRLVPAHRLSLDLALEYIRDDEAVEVTPDVIRLRKRALPAVDRLKLARRARRDE